MNTALYGALAGATAFGLVYLSRQPDAQSKPVPREETDTAWAAAQSYGATQLPPANESWASVGRKEEARASMENYGCGCGCGIAVSPEGQSRKGWDEAVPARQRVRDQVESGKFHGIWAPTFSAFQ